MNPCSVGQDQIENVSAIRRVQEHLGLTVDGWPGDKTWKAIQEKLGIVRTYNVDEFPNEDYTSMVDFYGYPGDESNLVRFAMPYPMRLYTRNAKPTITSHRCHKRVKDSLEAVLEDLLGTYGLQWITEHGLDVFGGVYNNRSKRGSMSKSKHAWGVAIDLNPAENGLHTSWPEPATMPVEAIEIFEKYGWKSLAREIGRDAMHFEATS